MDMVNKAFNEYILIKETIDKMKEVVKKFLLDNGGYENGFETYVNTIVVYNICGGSVDWRVPNLKEMKVGQYRELGYKLYDDLYECLSKDIKHIKFHIESQHDECGCYTTYIWAELPKERIGLY